jgi:MYXO-CTERM domain-containing protein
VGEIEVEVDGALHGDAGCQLSAPASPPASWPAWLLALAPSLAVRRRRSR